MFSSRRPYSFHIELTDKCNAGCPMCSRTAPMDRCRPNPDKVQNIELSLADFQEHFDAEFCRNVEEVQFGGGLGDPLAASECLEICDHLTRNGVGVVISTNGSLRNTGWWTRLGHILQRTPSHVELHVDGLKDTNPIYRVNTFFDKIMENARAYLATGAVAEWHYILFRHNEHQAEEARDLSRHMGFSKFVPTDTIRFGKKSNFPYQMPNGEMHFLEPATFTSAEFKARSPEPADGHAKPARRRRCDTSALKRPWPAENGIRCKSKRLNRPYINTEGYVSPCCWMAGSNEELVMYGQGNRPPAEYNIRTRKLAEILEDEPFTTLYEQAWKAGANAICQRKCGDMVRNTRQTV